MLGAALSPRRERLVGATRSGATLAATPARHVANRLKPRRFAVKIGAAIIGDVTPDVGARAHAWLHRPPGRLDTSRTNRPARILKEIIDAVARSCFDVGLEYLTPRPRLGTVVGW